MNLLITTDAYHITMGALVDSPLEMETHVLYARSGGPLVVPNLREVLQRLMSYLPTKRDVKEAASYWNSQQVMFPKAAWLQLVGYEKTPISIRGVRDGEIVLPGEPIAVVEAPALLAGIIEPYLIGEMMASVQWATRFTKLASAVNWDTARVFEVGMRATADAGGHAKAVRVLSRVGLKMTSNGDAARQVGIASAGTMGHRYTQRFTNDVDAFTQAIEKVLQYRLSNKVVGKSKLSFLLDTRSTLGQGLPAAMAVIQQYREVIREQIAVSIRFDSGDLDTQLKTAIAVIKKAFNDAVDWPGIIMESGLTPLDVARFEAIAVKGGYPRQKMFYGLGGYLVGAVDRDRVSMVYKLARFNKQPTMKFGDEADAAKASYPGVFTLMERNSVERVERCLVHEDDVAVFVERGWQDIFISLVTDGVVVAQEVSKDLLQHWICYRWDDVAKGYIGDDKRPRNFSVRPRMSTSLQALIAQLRDAQT